MTILVPRVPAFDGCRNDAKERASLPEARVYFWVAFGNVLLAARPRADRMKRYATRDVFLAIGRSTV